MVKISIIIPTYNRINGLKRVLAGLEKQDFPRDSFEVIVVSDGSTDGTLAYLSSLKTPLNLSFTNQKNGGAAVARNHGFAQARGEVILFIDDDVAPASDLISEHIRFHELNSNTVVLGPMLTPGDYKMSPWIQWEQAMLAKQYEAMLANRWEPTARQFYTGNTSLARKYLIEAGGFDPSFRRAEDVELAYRLAGLGLRFVFNPEAVVYHYAERSFNSWISTPYAYGANDVTFTQKKGQQWLLPVVFEEYHHRHRFTKILAQVCLDRSLISRTVIHSLKLAAQVSNLLSLKNISQLAYSGIFNLRYYQGVADQYGGRKIFFSNVTSTFPKGDFLRDVH